MQIILDEQDVMDSVHVFIAAQGNRGVVEGSEPHHVINVELFHNIKDGFSAKGYYYGNPYYLNQQDFIDAIGVTNSVAGCKALVSQEWRHREAAGVDLYGGALCRYGESNQQQER